MTNTLANLTLVIFFSSIILLSKNAVPEIWVAFFCVWGDCNNLEESFVWGYEWNWTDLIFWLTNVCFSNLNTIKLNLLYHYVRVYRFERKFMKYSGEINPLRVHRNIAMCILEVNSEGLRWQSAVYLMAILLILILRLILE